VIKLETLGGVETSMATIWHRRLVKLVDNRVPERPLIEASVYRGFLEAELDEIEATWSRAREKAAEHGQAAGLAGLEHAHWDWRNKADSVEAGRHMLVAADCDHEIQGLMAILRLPRPALLSPGHVVYVDYLESAPWNLKGLVEAPRFLGVGTILMAEAVRISIEESLEGRVGLHSLPQAEAFYVKCGMTRVGIDSDYYDLTYFEFSGRDGMNWLNSIGAS
jgi:hypothetical protein